MWVLVVSCKRTQTHINAPFTSVMWATDSFLQRHQHHFKLSAAFKGADVVHCSSSYNKVFIFSTDKRYQSVGSFSSSSDLRNQPYRRTDGGRHSAKWKPGQQLHVSSDISLWKAHTSTTDTPVTAATSFSLSRMLKTGWRRMFPRRNGERVKNWSRSRVKNWFDCGVVVWFE